MSVHKVAEVSMLVECGSRVTDEQLRVALEGLLPGETIVHAHDEEESAVVDDVRVRVLKGEDDEPGFRS